MLPYCCKALAVRKWSISGANVGVRSSGGRSTMPSSSSVGTVRLERTASHPILSPIEGSDWESRTVFNTAVADVDGATVLIYRGQGAASDVSRLSFAVSTDGVTFARLDRPVFVPDTPTEDYGVEDPRLTYLDGR